MKLLIENFNNYLKEDGHEKPQKEINADLILPVGKEVILQADTKEHQRGVVVEWLEDGGYDVYYWYGDPAKVVPAELKADGKLVGDSIKRVYLGYHPELDNTKDKEKIEEKDDRCTRIAKRKYDVWPSAYASGAVVKCRKGKIWKGLKEAGMISEEEEDLVRKITKALRDEGGAAGMDALIKHTKAKEAEIEDTIEDEEKLVVHPDGDIILKDDSLDEKKKKAGTESSKESSLHDWFGRKGAKGKSSGWVDCNTCRKDKKTGRKTCKSCGRQKGEKRSKYPSCRPTPGACGEKGKGKSWGKKSEALEVYTEIYIADATLDDGTLVEDLGFWDDELTEAYYQGKKVTLNKPTRGDVKKFKVYVNSGKKDSKGRIKAKKVNFGDKNMKIKKSNPKRRKSFRARHNCDNPGPKTKARYWSCRKW